MPKEDKSGTKASSFRGLNGPRESSIARLLCPSLISSFILESLEALLMCHPAVDDATVTGFYVKGLGRLPRAYVVIKKGYSSTAEEILSYANARYVLRLTSMSRQLGLGKKEKERMNGCMDEFETLQL